MTKTKPKALLIRIDRMGDLVLTLPVDQNSILKNYDCSWYITQGLGFVAEHCHPPRKFTEWKKSWNWLQFFRFLRAVHALQPELSVSFHVPWWVNMALFLARVPQRVGVLSQWHSYLFLNKAVRQKRSECHYHEMDYNHRLVFEGLKQRPDENIKPLELQALQPAPVAITSPYIVVHPGMGGSALNWPVEHYRHLISFLSAQYTIIITGTPSDNFIIEPLKGMLKNNTHVMWMNGKLKGAELISVLAKSKAVIAPSTGVIHLAASLSVPTFGLYSPIKVESPQRWGPRGSKVQTFTPSPQGEMKDIDPMVVAKAILESIK